MKRQFFAIFILSFCSFVATAQLDALTTSYNVTPAHKWEVGIHSGHFFSSGDIPFDPGYGLGFHVRRALDYVFSYRIEGQYGKLRGERFNGDDPFNTTWTSLSAHGIVSLNNLKWDDTYNRTNIYLYLGGGFNNFDSEFTPTTTNGNKRRIDNARSTILDIGLGISIRLNEDMNIGVDHKFTTLFSKYADRVDGFANQGFRDMMSYTSIRLNYNIGRKDQAEPLYWMNPLSSIIEDIQTIKKRQATGPEDSDEDGVPDYLDLEPETPIDAIVDIRGVTLDSDQDGIPDHKDAERYSPPNYEYDEKGVAIQPKYVTEDELNDRLAAQRRMILSLLPVVHFRTNQTELRPTEVTKVRYIGDVMRTSPDIRIVVIGYADQQGSEAKNDVLSYERAKKIIDYLIDNEEIERDRLVLNWKGEMEDIVMEEEDSYMNRRVEFKVASDEQEDQEPPKGVKKKKGY